MPGGAVDKLLLQTLLLPTCPLLLLARADDARSPGTLSPWQLLNRTKTETKELGCGHTFHRCATSCARRAVSRQPCACNPANTLSARVSDAPAVCSGPAWFRGSESTQHALAAGRLRRPCAAAASFSSTPQVISKCPAAAARPQPHACVCCHWSSMPCFLQLSDFVCVRRPRASGLWVNACGLWAFRLRLRIFDPQHD